MHHWTATRVKKLMEKGASVRVICEAMEKVGRNGHACKVEGGEEKLRVLALVGRREKYERGV